jgi:hypothetical protein
VRLNTSSVEWLKRSPRTLFTCIPFWRVQDHIGTEHANGTLEATLEHLACAGPSLRRELFVHRLGKHGPYTVANLPPFFLEERGKRALIVPAEVHVPVIKQVVLCQPYAVKILVVQPVHIGVGIRRVPTAAIDFAPIHGPQVRDHVIVVFGNVGGDRIDYLAVNGR